MSFKPDISNIRPNQGHESDYFKADRSNAFSPEDIRFGRLAQWAELITPKQFQKLLHDQKRMADSHQAVTDIATLLLREKLLTREQIKALHSARLGVPNGKADSEFASAAQKMGVMTPNQVEECRKIQFAALREGKDPLPLPLIAHEKRFIPENTIIALLKGGELQRWGIIHQIKKGPDEVDQGSRWDDLLGPPKSHERRVRLLGIAVFTLLFGILISRVVSGPPGFAYVQCVECRAEGVAPADTRYPAKCTECGQMGRYPLVICRECGTRFVVKNIGSSPCPNCQSVQVLRITNKTIEESRAIEAATSGQPVKPEGTP